MKKLTRLQLEYLANKVRENRKLDQENPNLSKEVREKEKKRIFELMARGFSITDILNPKNDIKVTAELLCYLFQLEIDRPNLVMKEDFYLGKEKAIHGTRVLELSQKEIGNPEFLAGYFRHLNLREIDGKIVHITQIQRDEEERDIS